MRSYTRTDCTVRIQVLPTIFLNHASYKKLSHLDSVSTQLIVNSCNVDIQCDLANEVKPSNTTESSWMNDWGEESATQDLSVEEPSTAILSNQDEINRLKAIISEIPLENESLKVLDSEFHETRLQNANTGTLNFSFEILFK